MKKGITLFTAAAITASMLSGANVIAADDANYSYTLDVSVKSPDGSELETIVPGSSFIAEVSVEEISERDAADYFVIAEYGLTGKLMGIQYAYMDVSTSAVFGITVPAQDEYVAEIKAYAWDGLSSMTPLAATVSKEYEGYQQYDMMTYCAPYDYTMGTAYLPSGSSSFTVSGDTYTEGFTLRPYGYDNAEAMFNLKNKYQSFTFSVGRVDSASKFNATMEIYVDEELVQTENLSYNALAKTYTVPLNYASQLRIVVYLSSYPTSYTYYGFFNGIFE